MSHLLDILLVGALLLASILYALLTIGPRSWRTGLSSGLAAIGLGRFAPKSSGACGGCDNCGSTTTPAKAGAETRVALKDIGRRPS